eukprot:4475547-Amphidinium_carterae.1
MAMASRVPIAVPLDKWLLWPPPFDYPPAALGPATGLFVIFFKVQLRVEWSQPQTVLEQEMISKIQMILLYILTYDL